METARYVDSLLGELAASAGGEDPAVAVAAAEPERASPPEDDEELSLARISLRLAEALKGRVELAASREGLSVNAWIVRALARSVEPPARGGRRLTGYARS